MKLFITSLRTLEKFRLYSIVNILGLAISLACVIIIARYVYQETAVNSFMPDLDRAYMISVENPEDGRTRFGGIPGLKGANIVLPSLLNNPSVERITSFFAFEEDYITLKSSRINLKALAVDSNFFHILPYTALYGNLTMTTPNDVVVTEAFAEKLFGKENPVGQRFIHSSGDELSIVGVICKLSSKSFLDFDILLNKDQRQFMAIQAFSLVMLYKGTDVKALNENNRQLEESRIFAPNPVRLQLFPLKDFYFDRSHELWNISRNKDVSVFVHGNKSSVQILSVVGILILLVGLFNFINIYTVIILRRGKEFGVKKMFGAGKGQIFRQLYAENFLMALIAVFGAWVFIEITQSYLSSRLGFVIMPNLHFSILLSIALLIFLPLITSVYPYLKYSYSRPIQSLRSVNIAGKSLVSRKLFIILQYAITFGLIVVALFFMKQLNYMLSSASGYNTQNVIVARMMHRDVNAMRSGNMEAVMQKIDANSALIKNRMNQSPLFSEWEFGLPVYNLEAKIPMKRSDKNEYLPMSSIRMSPKYMKMFGFQLKEGRLWDSTDVNGEFKCILNESAAKLFDVKDIQSATLESQYDRGESGKPQYQIIGIINDFHTGHLSKSTTPLIINFTAEGFHFDFLMARFIPEKQKEAVSFLESIYKEVNNGAEFTYSLLEDDIARLYEEDRRISRVYLLFSIIAILISCLGLFAVSLFDIRQRYREIALRKVNGAKTTDIMGLLLKKYFVLLSLAFAVAIPVSCIVVSKYLENFAYKITVSTWLIVFAAISAVIVLSVSLVTLIWQIREAMRANPATVLKSE